MKLSTIALSTLALAALAALCSASEVAAFNTDPAHLLKGSSLQYQVHTVSYSDRSAVCKVVRVRSKNGVKHKTPVVLQHGLFDSSDTWLLSGEGNSLATVLAQRGHDVWLLNSRGNQYCVTRNWEWSWDEMARVDFPESIKFVKRASGHSHVNVVAHSQGTCVVFAGLAKKWLPEADIHQFHALAPPVFLKHQGSKLFEAASTMQVDKILQFVPNEGMFVPTLEFANRFIKKTDLKYGVLSLIFGDSNNLKDVDWRGHFPSPTSTRNLIHWIQAVHFGGFNQFHNPRGMTQAMKDWWNNIDEPQPNAYPLDRVSFQKVHLHLYRGTTDLMTMEKDFRKLLATVKGQHKSINIIPGFAHMDFTWSKVAKQRVYENIANRLAPHKQAAAAAQSSL